MIVRKTTASVLFAFLLLGLSAGAAVAAGPPEPWQVTFQDPATPIMENIDALHDLLLIISVLICGLVLALLLFCVFRFREGRHPEPSRTTHHTLLEVAWTIVPVLILVVIAIPSFRLLYFQGVVPEAEMTLEVTGHQWYWSYQYPDNGGFGFDSFMVPDDQLEPGQPRLLTVDNPVVVPVDTPVRVLMTATDVLHAWAVPAFGIKTDTVPGRINEVWFEVTEEGTYYGQCSELCGVNHAYMPIEIQAVSKEAFAQWVAEAQQNFASGPESAPEPATEVAAIGSGIESAGSGNER